MRVIDLDPQARAHSEWVRSLYHRRVAEGKCGLCGKEREPGRRAVCAACNEGNCARTRERYADDVANRRCVRCHQALKAGETHHRCFTCRVVEAKETGSERRNRNVGKDRRMSLDEVRKLRIGQRVDLVFDRSGTRQRCVIRTISNGKIKVMSCVKEDGTESTYPIIGYTGAHYEEAEEGQK